MTIIDEQVEATHIPAQKTHEPRGRGHHRATRRPPEDITALGDRIRALQRAEPAIVGDLRTSVLSELALIELQLERLSLNAWRANTRQRQTVANAEALSEQVDRLAVHWPAQLATTERGLA